jgi:hypothetical protein
MRRRAHAGGLVDVLEREGDAEQGALLAGLARAVGGACRLARGLGQHKHEAVELAVDLLDAVDAGFDQRLRCQLARGERAARLDCGEGGGHLPALNVGLSSST